MFPTLNYSAIPFYVYLLVAICKMINLIFDKSFRNILYKKHYHINIYKVLNQMTKLCQFSTHCL